MPGTFIWRVVSSLSGAALGPPGAGRCQILAYDHHERCTGGSGAYIDSYDRLMRQMHEPVAL